MSIDISRLAPFIWALSAILGLVIVVIVIRFLWKHILRFALHGCAAILVILALLALLRYFKVF
jgi:hypothetical protein